MKQHRRIFIRLISVLLISALFVTGAPDIIKAAALTAAADDSCTAEDSAVSETAEQGTEYYDIIGEDESLRDAFTKHYILRDKSRVSVTSAEPVHYLADGVWQDIVPELKQGTDGRLHNGDGAFGVSFAADIAADGASQLTFDGYTVSWQAESTQKSRGSAQVSNRGGKKLGQVKKSELGQIPGASVSFGSVFSGADVEYVMAYNGVKENIIINSRSNKYEYSFIYSVNNGLSMLLNADGCVELISAQGETVFVIPAPYMTDANGEISYDAHYTLKNLGGGKYRLTAVADKSYMRSAALPVTLDPAIFIKRITEEGSIETAYLASGNKNGDDYASMTNLGKNKKILYVGYESSAYKWCRTYIGVSLPELSGSDIVTNAYISLMQKQGRYNSSSAQEEAVGIAPVTRSWDIDTLTWNMQKDDTFGAFLDYQYDVRSERSSGSGTYFDVPMQWNVTAAVKEWYAADELTSCASGNSSNFGFVLRLVNENISGTSPTAHAIYYNDRTTTDYAPCIVVEYRNAKGLEDYWSFHSQAAGRAGVGKINDYTGNLVFIHTDASTSGNRLPVSVSHIYNSYDADTADSVLDCGKGWRMNIAQTVKAVTDAAIAQDYPYVYTDADGTAHYFVSDGTALWDEDGLGYKLTVNSSGTYRYILADRSGGTMSFDASGRLAKVQDALGNYSTVAYSDGAVTVTDGAGEQIIIALSNGRVSSVTPPDGKAVTYTYDGTGRLTAVTYPDGKQSLYTYLTTDPGGDNAHPLIKAQDPGGYAVNYEYTANNARRVSRVYETAGAQQGQELRISYGSDASTVFLSAGTDGLFETSDDIKTVYQFNHWGHTVSCYSAFAADNELISAQRYEFGSTDYSAYNAANNRITTVASGSRGTDNLIGQPGMESMTGVTTMDETGSAVFALNPSDKLQGQYSGGISRVSADGGLSLYKQSISRYRTYNGQRSYTASVYVKAQSNAAGNGGVVIGVCPANQTFSAAYYTVVPLSELAGEENGWSRISFTVTPEASSAYENYTVYYGVYNLSGSVSFDCVQFEEGASASTYSMIGGACFDYGACGAWTFNGISAYLAVPAIGAYGTGAVGSARTVSQTVAFTGEDTLTLSAWASAAKAVPQFTRIKKATYSASSTPRFTVTQTTESAFCIKARVNYSDGTSSQDFACAYNTAVSGWQYASVSFNTAADGKTPVSVTVTLEYSNQLGRVDFCGVQMVSGSKNDYTYDANGFVSGLNDGKNAQSTETDSKGNVTSYTDINGQTTTYAYNTGNLLTGSTLPSGIRSGYSYDSYGNCTGTSTYTTVFPAASGPAEGITYLIRHRGGTDMFLDSRGIGDVRPYTGKQEQLFTLEKCGDYWYITAADGKVLSYTGVSVPMPNYSFADKITEAGTGQDGQLFSINCTGGVSEIKSKLHSTLVLVPSSYQGVRMLMAIPGGVQTNNNTWELENIAYAHPESISSSAEYSEDGRFMTSSTDEQGVVTQYVYEASTGRLLSFTDTTGTTSYTYDQNTGELLSVSKGDASVQYSYTDDKLTGITRGGVNYSFEYDGFGNNTKIKIGDNTLSQSQYDIATGMIINSQLENGCCVDFEYDHYGRIIKLKYNDVIKCSYEYDKAGKITECHDYENNRIIKYSYDNNGRLILKQTSDGQVMKFVFDERSYLKKDYFSVNGVNFETEYQRGDGTADRLYKGIIYNVSINKNNTQIFSKSNTYDTLQRLSQTTVAFGEYVQNIQFGYEFGTDIPISLTINNDSITYEYNLSGKISKISVDDLISYYQYDALGQLIREDNAFTNRTVIYTYDNAGNICLVDEYIYSPSTQTDQLTNSLRTVEYSYNNNQWKDQVTSVDGYSIEYDQIGNVTSYNGKVLSWYGRQLNSISVSNTETTYKYDDGGLRTCKISDGVTTKYYYSDGVLLSQQTGDSYLYFIYDENLELVGFTDGTNVYAYIKNLYGDILAVVDTESGAHVADYTYNTWGELLSASGTMAQINPFRYRSYYYDNESGLYYLLSRYYDPCLKRFISADGQINAGILGKNMYAYCSNDPVLYSDPTGEYGIYDSLAFPGEIHQQVQKYIVKNTSNIIMEVRVEYINNKGVKQTGRIDLYDVKEGKIWEVKPVNSKANPMTQLEKYCNSVIIDSRVAAKSVKGYGGYLQGSFLYKDYRVIYWTEEPGVIRYEFSKYDDKTPKKDNVVINKNNNDKEQQAKPKSNQAQQQSNNTINRNDLAAAAMLAIAFCAALCATNNIQFGKYNLLYN